VTVASRDRDFLKSVYLFSDLSDEETDKVGRICSEFKALQGEHIIVEGEKGESMYVLVEGSVEISKHLTLLTRGDFDEKDKTLIILRADTRPFFGEMGLLGGEERTATVTAISNCTLLEIRRADFEALCKADPMVGYQVLRKIALVTSERLKKTTRDVMKLTTALSLALEQK
jgi:CRP-like cAMP-binding protein